MTLPEAAHHDESRCRCDYHGDHLGCTPDCRDLGCTGDSRLVRELEARLAEAQSAERNSDDLRRERYAGQVTGLKTALSIVRAI